MGFKSNREFLRNVTVGAVGTRQVARLLTDAGCQIIELERYSQHNKIWATKVKRLRVPDLLCLRCGRRIESRAKGKLEIRMSHSRNNPDRVWDKGLRDQDLVVFVACTVNDDIQLQASTDLAIVTVADLRATRHLAKESEPKSASEGSEVYLTWPAWVPAHSGTVTEVTAEKIKVRYDNDRNYTYQLSRRDGVLYSAHVTRGSTFRGESRIVASVIPRLINIGCPATQSYDFLRDIRSDDRETAFAAVKALGFRQDLQPHSVEVLTSVAQEHDDPMIRLEASASLARLNNQTGWDAIREAAATAENTELQMEALLIAGEMGGDHSLRIVSEVALDQSLPSEARAAAVWAMATGNQSLEQTPLMRLVADADEQVAVHAIVATSQRIDSEQSLEVVLRALGNEPRQSAGIVHAIRSSAIDPVPRILAAIRTAQGSARSWLIYLLATLGRERCENAANEEPDLVSELTFFWTFHGDNWTNRMDVAEQLDLLQQQFVG